MSALALFTVSLVAFHASEYCLTAHFNRHLLSKRCEH